MAAGRWKRAAVVVVCLGLFPFVVYLQQQDLRAQDQSHLHLHLEGSRGLGWAPVAVAKNASLAARRTHAAAADASPPTFRPTAAAAAPSTSSRVHVVFSTDCGAFMAWQAVALLDSAARVGQRGVFTRLVHGCDAAAEARLREETACDGYPFPVHLHFTKDFNNDFHVDEAGNASSSSRSPKRFRFANKPRGVRHWLAHHGDEFRENHAHDDEDVVIVLVDPDFVFLRPFDLWAGNG